MSELKLSIEILTAVGSFLTGIVMLITMIRVVSRLNLKEEVFYGDEASSQYKKIEDKLQKNGFKVDTYEYKGGSTKIIPRLEFEKFTYISAIMEDKLRGYKKRVRFIDDNKIVHTWYLK
jgi:hypothetical protein